MSQPSLIPVALLYTQGNRPIEGATRFQKLVFLAQEESELPSKYDYYPYKYGPFSPQLKSDLEAHIRRGHIQRNVVYNKAGNQKHIYSLTPEGIQFAKHVLSQTNIDPVFQALQGIKRKYNDWSLDRLIRYVYGSYSDLTTETELDLENLFDPEADSQFLEPGDGSGSQFSHIDELGVETLRLSGTGEQLERAKLRAFWDQELRVEKFDHGRISVYWPSSLDFGSFLAQVREDGRISEESQCETRLVEETGWLRGPYGEVVSEVDRFGDCQFIAIASDNCQYEVTWEKGKLDNDDNEITVLFLPDDDRDMSMVRSALAIYLTPDISEYDSGGDVDRFVVSNDHIRESLWEATMYLLA